MFRFLRKYECRCPAEPQAVPEPAKPAAEVVPLTSPAPALELSLTSSETRGEWTYEWVSGLPYGGSGHAVYRNAARAITLTRMPRMFGTGSVINTPFTLGDGEERVVQAALERFDTHRRQVAELAAVARLTAQGIEAAKPARPERARPKAKARSAKADAPDHSDSSPTGDQHDR